MSDQPDRPDDGAPAAGGDSGGEPDIVDADDVALSEPSVAADSLEPTLSASADDIALEEPSLAAAEISAESAEAASLDEVAAEAESVAQEAEDVGTLVAGPRAADDPSESAAPAGTAPAGGAAGDVAEAATGEPEGEPEGPTSSVASLAASGDEPAWTGTAEDQSRWDELFEEGQVIAAAADTGASTDTDTDTGADTDADTDADIEVVSHSTASDSPTGLPAGITPPPWKAPAVPEHSGQGAPPAGGPYGLPPAEAEDTLPTRRSSSTDPGPRSRSRKQQVILGVIGLVAVALVVFGIIALVNAFRDGDGDPDAEGVLAENVSPLELEAGACILDFDSANVSADVTTVSCSTPHNAQLLATTSFPEESEFPGEAALNARGEELCNTVAIDEAAAAEYPELTLTQVTPTTDTWAEGDRRVDCFVVSDEGNVIAGTLLAE